jgi:hypothetical protein
MAMGMKPSLNILMRFGPMILISWLGHFYACFIALKNSQLSKHELFEFEPQSAFFQQVMQGSFHCLNALKLVDKIVNVKPLPRKLLL